jgi:hypothetical protein
LDGNTFVRFVGAHQAEPQSEDIAAGKFGKPRSKRRTKQRERRQSLTASGISLLQQ